MATRSKNMDGGLTAVLDVGKTRAKLVVFDEEGRPICQPARANASVRCVEGYPALDAVGIEAWLLNTLAALPERSQIRHIIATTHGAALAGIANDRLALPIPDYEFDGFREFDATYRAARDPFGDTLSPDLPCGLNAARQLWWLQHRHADAFSRVQTWLPYAQYWAWRLSGVAASEASSLGCHTQLWQPQSGKFSELAKHQGWAERFAPLRRAWEPLGPVRDAWRERLGLPADCTVYCGAHDSNACLANYLATSSEMSLVSTGTWIVVMAPGADAAQLDADADMLGNVSVLGETVPTARFMGGREFEVLLAGADARDWSMTALQALVDESVCAVPSFSTQGGPFRDHAGAVLRQGRPMDWKADLPVRGRASLAALYCAAMTAHLLGRLRARGPVVIDGPFAKNALYVEALQCLLPHHDCHVSLEVDGTARGAWALAHWRSQAAMKRPPRIRRVVVREGLQALVRRYLAQWNQALESIQVTG